MYLETFAQKISKFKRSELLLRSVIPYGSQTKKILDTVAELIRTSVKIYNDESCCELLQVLWEAYKAADEFISLEIKTSIESAPPHERESIKYLYLHRLFLKMLIELYFTIPAFREYYDQRPLEEVVLRRSRLWILNEISSQWNLRELSSESIEAFRFLTNAFEQRSPLIGAYDGELQDGILKIIHEKTGSHVACQDLEKWIKKEPYVPRPILQKLVMARARNGGPELALRDIKNAELIAKCNLIAAAQTT